jgi:hypothetical protein
MTSTPETPHRKRRRRHRRSWWRLSPQQLEQTVETKPASIRDSTHPPSRRRGRSLWRVTPVAGVVLTSIGLLTGAIVTKIASDRARAQTPAFHRLTFALGTVRSARFGEDGAVIYAAAWDGGPTRPYMTRLSGAASTPLDLPPAQLLSVSRSGELAVLFNSATDGEPGTGTLSETSMSGGRTNRLAENIREAEWASDGESIAVVRRVGSRDQLEWPLGKTVYATSGYLSALRLSRDGKRLAFVEHPIYGDESGDIVTMDAEGRRNALVTNLPDVRGLAWARGDAEVWFTAASDDPQGLATLQAIDMSGRRRTVLDSALDLTLMDIDSAGRVLLAGETRLNHVEALLPGQERVRDFSSIDAVAARGISRDGTQVLITRRRTPNVLVRRTDRNEDVPLGDGDGFDLSSDGLAALSIISKVPSRVLLFAPRSREVTEIANPGGLAFVNATLLPGSGNLVLLGGRPGEPWRGYIHSVSNGTTTRFTRLGVTPLPMQKMVVTPDGNAVALRDPAGKIRTFPTGGGEPAVIPGLADGEFPLSWSDDPSIAFVTGAGPSWRIDRLNVTTGQRTPWKEVTPMQNTGVTRTGIAISPDGEALVYSYEQVLSNLYVVDGLN